LRRGGGGSGQQQQQQFLYLTTTGWKTGRQHRIEIWFVEHDNKRYYVMSELRKRAHWVQNIVHNPRVSFRVSNDAFEGTARIVDKRKEPGLAAEISKLMGAKYGWDQGLIVELAPTASSAS
jgi:deazaflavin-dependent oxidoreductase (nitroreductase family)